MLRAWWLAALAGLAGCAADRGDLTLKVASWADPIEMGIEQRYIERFGRERPGVDVSLESVTNQAEYRDRILTSIAAGTPPDVFLLDNIDIPAFAA